jgi:hypothetical protein
MADKKISALTGATTPLAGTEVLPIVQSGATVKVAVSDLTAGRAISATAITASTGNFIVGTSGQGIDFSATPGTGTSELLADYEEGTWTPTPGSGTFSSATGRYTKIGRVVNLTFNITVGTGGATNMTGAPFTCGFNASNSIYTEGQIYPVGGTSPLTLMGAGGTTINFVCVGTTLGFTSLTLTASAAIIGSLTYTV